MVSQIYPSELQFDKANTSDKEATFLDLQQGISEPIFYGNLVYKFKRIVGKPNFSD